MFRLVHRPFSHLHRPLLTATGLMLFLSGCCFFRSNDVPADDASDSEAIPAADIGFTPEGTNLPARAISGTNTAAAATNATGAARLAVFPLPSPNFDRRRLPVSLIVLHYTAAPLRESLNALRNARGPNRVSAHYVVTPNGTIYRLVDEAKRAWHAGVARWNDIVDVNSASIGIEMVNLGHDRHGLPRPYPAEQIEAVISLCLDIQSRYDIRAVVGHSDVAPLRKIDPGELFPWGKLAKRGVKVRRQAKTGRRP